jgi:hypothetical protein
MSAAKCGQIQTQEDAAVNLGRNRENNCLTTPTRSLMQINAHLNLECCFFGFFHFLLLYHIFYVKLLVVFSYLCFGCIHRSWYTVEPSFPEGAQLND